MQGILAWLPLKSQLEKSQGPAAPNRVMNQLLLVSQGPRPEPQGPPRPRARRGGFRFSCGMECLWGPESCDSLAWLLQPWGSAAPILGQWPRLI